MNLINFISLFFIFAEKPLYKDFENYVAQTIEKYNIPGGMAIAIIDGTDEEIITVNNKNFEKITSDTIFPIASFTKNITATLIAVLVDKGLLSFDDKIHKYAPSFKIYDEEVTNKITIRDILGQSLGLPHFSGDTLLKLGFESKDIFCMLSKIPPEKKARKNYSYQNQFYGLMQCVIEKASGMTLDEAAKKHLFHPLGMYSTSYKNPLKPSSFLLGCTHALPKNFATLYHDVKKPRRVDLSQQLWVHPSSMGVASTILDLLKWLKFDMYGNEKVLSKKNYDELRRVHVDHHVSKDDLQFLNMTDLGYGLGTFVYKYRGNQAYGHMGGWSGMRSLLAYMPEKKFGMVILSNYGTIGNNLFLEAFRYWLFDTFLGVKPVIDWAQKIYEEREQNYKQHLESQEKDFFSEIDRHEPFSKLVGKYKNDLYGELEIYEKNKQLRLKYYHHDLPLAHINGNIFDMPYFDQFYYDQEPHYMFFMWKDGKQGLYVSAMFEGEDPYFYKV